jgi:hypothetical protein
VGERVPTDQALIKTDDQAMMSTTGRGIYVSASTLIYKKKSNRIEFHILMDLSRGTL